MISIFLIGDQSIMRAMLRLRLGLEEDLEVVGDSGNDDDTISHVRALAPDVVILDAMTILFDGGHSSSLLRELALDWPVVVLSLHDDAETHARALTAGARHVVCKHGPDGHLLAAIRAAAAPSPRQTPPFDGASLHRKTCKDLGPEPDVPADRRGYCGDRPESQDERYRKDDLE